MIQLTNFEKGTPAIYWRKGSRRGKPEMTEGIPVIVCRVDGYNHCVTVKTENNIYKMVSTRSLWEVPK